MKKFLQFICYKLSRTFKECFSQDSLKSFFFQLPAALLLLALLVYVYYQKLH
ncbi:hypothetical protein HELA111659_09890 [Helicobacter labetoulli]